MNEQVTEAQLFEMLGRLYASREMLRLQFEDIRREFDVASAALLDVRLQFQDVTLAHRQLEIDNYKLRQVRQKPKKRAD